MNRSNPNVEFDGCGHDDSDDLGDVLRPSFLPESPSDRFVRPSDFPIDGDINPLDSTPAQLEAQRSSMLIEHVNANAIEHVNVVGRAIVVPEFHPSAPDVFKFLNETMAPDWWHYAFHSPFSTERCTTQNEIRIVDNKLASEKEFLDNRISYRFRRSIDDHFNECQCAICATTLLFQGDGILDRVSTILGFRVDLNTSFMSYYASGDFLSPHTDAGNGDIAFVWNLTSPRWRPQYGGLLNFLNKSWEESTQVIAPTFNSLVMFDVDGGLTPHFVSHVAPNVKEKRLAFSGWFRRMKEGEERAYPLLRRRLAAAQKTVAAAKEKVESNPIKDLHKRIPGTFMYPQFYDFLVTEEALRIGKELGRAMRFVEIGVYKGQSAAYFAEKCIETFQGGAFTPEINLVDLGLKSHGGSITQNLASIAHLVHNEFDMASVEAATKFEDGFFDVVFIDADHAYESVRDDIAAWLPKVRPGGIIAGHDFARPHPGVMKAVLEAFPSITVERGEIWSEMQWRVVTSEEAKAEVLDREGKTHPTALPEYIPVWWVRLPEAESTESVVKGIRQGLTITSGRSCSEYAYPDLEALKKDLTTGYPFLQRIYDRSNAYDKGYGTNVPLLAAVLAIAPPGDVLEIGAGNFSTPLLSEMCLATGRRLVTVEHNTEWIKNFDDVSHTVRVSDPSGSSASMNEMSHGLWAVALVDQAGDYDRASSIESLRRRTAFIVVHDTHNAFFRGVDDLLATFRYRYDYTAMCPPTTVVSMTHRYPGAER